MKHAVIDASVAIKWFIPEADSPTADALLAQGFAFHAPDFLKLELGNAFWKNVLRGHIPADAFHVVLPELELSINHWHPTTALLPEAFELACELQHPIYDCIYLALAKRHALPLVTADRKLATKLKETAHGDRLVGLSQWQTAL